MERYDVIVIGQGYAGLMAAKHATDRGLRVASFEALCMGGLILNINELNPVPNGGEQNGAELAGNLLMTAMDNGVVSVPERVSSVRQGPDKQWIVSGDSDEYCAPNLIVASGASLRKLGVPGEEEFFGRGISECADCDGPLFDGKETVVVGGGDSAFQEAAALAHFASKVTIVMRGAEPRARKDLVDVAGASPKIVLRPNSRVTEIFGSDSGVTGIRVADGAGVSTIPCEGIFVFIGLAPNTSFLPPGVRRDDIGAVVAGTDCKSSETGLWAIGAARSMFGGLLEHAAQDAKNVVAAL